jgi:hypothetical protein
MDGVLSLADCQTSCETPRSQAGDIQIRRHSGGWPCGAKLTRNAHC